jgi:hypothetical protein
VVRVQVQVQVRVQVLRGQVQALALAPVQVPVPVQVRVQPLAPVVTLWSVRHVNSMMRSSHSNAPTSKRTERQCGLCTLTRTGPVFQKRPENSNYATTHGQILK